MSTEAISRRVYEYAIHRKPLCVAEPIEPFRTSVQVAAVARQVLGPIDHEAFLVFHLDSKNRMTGVHEAARGGYSTCAVDPAQVFRAALLNGARAIILAHNHPSNDPSPSADDIAFTKRIVEGSQLLGLRVLDHVIVADDSHYSMLDHSTVDFSNG